MNSNEIGSEFWTSCSPTSKNFFSMRSNCIYGLYPYKIAETLSGRTALEYIAEILVKKKKRKVYLPSYCCDTMIEPFLSNGLGVKFYDVHKANNGFARLVGEGVDYDAILLMDYFGHIDEETIELARKEKAKGKTVIYDVTHSMYSDINVEPYDFVYGSYRKWVDINCGFLAWKEELEHGEITQSDDNQEYADIRRQLFDKKATYMNDGTIEKDEFLPLINEAEAVLERTYRHKMPDERSMEVLRTADAAFLKVRRRENAKVLTEAINDMNDERVRCITPIVRLSDVSLFVPVLVNTDIRNSLRKYLIEHQIYCPVHWPLSDLHVISDEAKQLYQSELSLVCDQRYDHFDMYRIVETIKNYLKK